LQRVSRLEVDWLIEKGFLKLFRGNLRDLVVTNRGRKKGNKHRYIPDNIARNLSKMKDYKTK